MSVSCVGVGASAGSQTLRHAATAGATPNGGPTCKPRWGKTKAGHRLGWTRAEHTQEMAAIEASNCTRDVTKQGEHAMPPGHWNTSDRKSVYLLARMTRRAASLSIASNMRLANLGVKVCVR